MICLDEVITVRMELTVKVFQCALVGTFYFKDEEQTALFKGPVRTAL
jgi:hypothetical protein